MYVGRDFDVSDPGEQEAYAFDFVNDLAANDSITGAQWFCTVDEGVDLTPSARLIGTPWFVGTTVTAQVIGTGIPGVNYILQAVARTARGMTLSLFSHSRCEIIP